MCIKLYSVSGRVRFNRQKIYSEKVGNGTMIHVNENENERPKRNRLAEHRVNEREKKWKRVKK